MKHWHLRAPTSWSSWLIAQWPTLGVTQDLLVMATTVLDYELEGTTGCGLAWKACLRARITGKGCPWPLFPIVELCPSLSRQLVALSNVLFGGSEPMLLTMSLSFIVHLTHISFLLRFPLFFCGWSLLHYVRMVVDCAQSTQKKRTKTYQILGYSKTSSNTSCRCRRWGWWWPSCRCWK